MHNYASVCVNIYTHIDTLLNITHYYYYYYDYFNYVDVFPFCNSEWVMQMYLIYTFKW